MMMIFAILFVCDRRKSNNNSSEINMYEILVKSQSVVDYVSSYEKINPNTVSIINVMNTR